MRRMSFSSCQPTNRSFRGVGGLASKPIDSQAVKLLDRITLKLGKSSQQADLVEKLDKLNTRGSVSDF